MTRTKNQMHIWFFYILLFFLYEIECNDLYFNFHYTLLIFQNGPATAQFSGMSV